VKTLAGAEVSALGESLNLMIQRIQQLMDEVKRDQATLREAELELLQAQINPHFLYNTLDTIIWLAEDGQKKRIVAMVKALSDFFRTSLNRGAEMATLREEERHVRSYLQIQQVRYQDILEYSLDIPADCYETELPKITLQPLVENALYHGIKRKRGKGVISIQAHRSRDDVIVTVKDDGAGMPADKLNRLRALLTQRERIQKQKDSYGLYNVNERIKLRFGAAYGIEILAAPNEGVTVEIHLPLSEQRPI
jgi:two-component system sensor histidine kinase YesM